MKIQAQYDVSFSHYFNLEPSFNSAAVGKESKINVALDYAMDLAGFEHNPQTMYAAADMPLYFLKTYHGVGLQFMNDKLGLFSHQRLMLQYALKFKLFKGTLSAGVTAGLLSETFDGTKADLEDSNDPARPRRGTLLHPPQLVCGTLGTAPQFAMRVARRTQRVAGGPDILFDRRIQY